MATLRKITLNWEIRTGAITCDTGYIKRQELCDVDLYVTVDGTAYALDTSWALNLSIKPTLLGDNAALIAVTTWTASATTGLYQATAQTMGGTALDTYLAANNSDTTDDEGNKLVDLDVYYTISTAVKSKSDTVTLILKPDVGRADDTVPATIIARNDFLVSNGTGLLVNVAAGYAANGAFVAAQASLAITNATNYIEVTAAGVASVNTTAFTAGSYPLATVVASAGAITSNTDLRAWITPKPATSTGLTVGTSAITGGTTTRILYDNAGVLGEYTISGTGSVAMTTSPTFTTPDLGTPSALVGTNITGTASGLTAGNATLAATVTVANEATDTTCFPLFATAATGSLAALSNAGLTFNSATGLLSATGLAGAFNGTVGATTPSTIAGTTGAFSGELSTSGANASIYTSGANASIYTGGVNAYIFTNGANAQIYTTGSDATITTGGINAYISTDGANANISTNGGAYIETSSTLKLNNGTFVTTLSHGATANRAIAFPDAAGTLLLADGSGANLTALNASNISSGTLADARNTVSNSTTTTMSALAAISSSGAIGITPASAANINLNIAGGGFVATSTSHNGAVGYIVTNSNASSGAEATFMAVNNSGKIHTFGMRGSATGGYGTLPGAGAEIYANKPIGVYCDVTSNGSKIDLGVGSGGAITARHTISPTDVGRASSHLMTGNGTENVVSVQQLSSSTNKNATVTFMGPTYEKSAIGWANNAGTAFGTGAFWESWNGGEVGVLPAMRIIQSANGSNWRRIAVEASGDTPGDIIFYRAVATYPGEVVHSTFAADGSTTHSGTLAVTGATTLTGNLTSNGALISVPQALSGNGAVAAVNLTTLTTTIANTGTANTTTTLAAGTNGQTKIISFITDGGFDAVITVTNPAWGGAGTITMNDALDNVMLIYLNSVWQVFINNGCTLA